MLDMSGNTTLFHLVQSFRKWNQIFPAVAGITEQHGFICNFFLVNFVALNFLRYVYE